MYLSIFPRPLDLYFGGTKLCFGCLDRKEREVCYDVFITRANVLTVIWGGFWHSEIILFT